MMEKEKPMGWEYVKLGEISTIQSGGTPARGKSNYWGGDIPWVKISDLKEFYVSKTDEFITEEGLSNSSSRIFPSGTILFTIFASIGKIGVLKIDAATNQAVAGITPSKHLDWKFLTYSLLDLSLSIQQHGKGVAQKNINLTILKSTLIPIPPLPEQKRIVAKLDALFGHLDVLREKLDRIPELLKNFRQQVLTQAVTGKLTEEYRKTKELKGWKFEKAQDCCEKVQSGGTPKKDGFSDTGIPFLKVYNIVNNKVDFEYRPQFVNEEAQNGKIKKSILYPGDVLMNIVGPPLNKIAIVPADYAEWNLNQAITLFRPKEYLTNQFLYYFFCEGSSVRSVTNETRGVVGQVNISLTQCRNFEIPIPPKEEQVEILNKVNQLFSAADKIEAQYQSLKEKIDQLPQAILAKAFKGELVAQDENDEPAGVLLERIKGNKTGKGSKKAYEQEERLGMVAEDKENYNGN